MKAIVDLAGKRGLVAGIANDSSIAYGCARAFRAAGAELAVTYLNAKAEPYVRPLAESLGGVPSSYHATCASPVSWRRYSTAS